MLSTQYLRQIRLKREEVPSFDRYPFALPAVRHLEALDLHPRVTFFIGENGSGKSTLLEAIAVAFGFNPEGGSRNFSFGTRESHSELHRYLRLSKGIVRPRDGFFLRAESFFNVATEIERLDQEGSFGPPVIDSYGGVSLHEQSHGEAFLALLMNRFGVEGLYLLDEPEAALSPQRQLAVLARLHDLADDGSQFVIATHSPILMAYPEATIYNFSPAGIEQVAYTDTEHYRVTRDFLLRPERMLDILLDRSPDRDDPPDPDD
jgi:predicted ATPase